MADRDTKAIGEKIMGNLQQYENYVSYDWWTHIDSRNIEGWLQNFEDHDNIGKLILDSIIFYNEEQIKSYTRNIVNQLKSEVYEREMRVLNGKYHDDDYFDGKWEKYKEAIRVMPADAEDRAGGSPHLVARKYRPYLGEEIVVKVDSIQKNIKEGIKEFIFVDDFSGTGKQMSDFLSTLIEIDGKKVPIGKISEYFSDIKVSVAVYVIHKDALERLKEEFRTVSIRYVDLLDERLNLLSYDCITYQGKSKDEIREIIDYLSEIKTKLLEEQPDYQKFAEYELHIPIIFEHGCPNNTFIPFYAKTKTWKQLFKRGNEI